MKQKVLVKYIDYDTKGPEGQRLTQSINIENGINEMFETIDAQKGTVVKVMNWSRESLRGAQIVVLYTTE